MVHRRPNRTLLKKTKLNILYLPIYSIIGALNGNFLSLEENVKPMNKKMLLFKYETFTVRKPKCAENNDASRKRQR